MNLMSGLRFASSLIVKDCMEVLRASGLFFVCLFSWHVPSALALDWPAFGGGPDNRRLTSEQWVGSPSASWQANVGAGALASPIAADGLIFVGGGDGKLRAFRAKDGTLAWSADAASPFESAPLYVKGKLIAISRKGAARAFDAQTGQGRWNVELGDEVFGSPSTDGSSIFLGTGYPGGRVVALALADGKTRWSYTVGQIIQSSTAVDGNRVYIGANNGKFLVLDAANGTLLFTHTTTGGVYRSSPVVSQGWMFALPGNIDRSLYVLNASTGLLDKFVDLVTPAGHAAPARRASPREPPSQAAPPQVPPLDASNPFQPDFAEKLRTGVWDEPPGAAFDPQDGGSAAGGQEPGAAAPRRAPTAAALSEMNFVSSPATDGSTLYALGGSGTQHLFAVNPSNGSIAWATDMGPPGNRGFSPSPLLAAPNALMAVTADGKVRRVDRSNGTVLQEIDLGEAVFASPAFANGRLAVLTEPGTLRTFVTSNSPPSLPDVTKFQPAPNSTLDTHRLCGNSRCADVTLSWPAASDPETSASQLVYLIEIDDDPDLDDRDSGFNSYTTTGAASFVLPDPVPVSQKRYWRLRVQDPEKAESPWGSVIVFQVLTPAPPTVVLSLAARLSGLDAQISWSPGAGTAPAGYRLQVNSGSTIDLGNVTQHTVKNLLPGQTYVLCITPYSIEGDPGPQTCTTVNLLLISSGPAIPPSQPATEVPPPPAALAQTATDLAVMLATAKAGDVLALKPGIFEGRFVVPAGVSLKGTDPQRTIIRGGGPGQGPAVTLEPSAKMSLAIVLGGDPGIVVKGTATIHNTVVARNTTGILVAADTSRGSEISLVNLTLTENKADGVTLDATLGPHDPSTRRLRSEAEGASEGVSVVIRNTIFSHNGGAGIRCGAVNPSVTYSNFFKNAQGPARDCDATVLPAAPGWLAVPGAPGTAAEGAAQVAQAPPQVLDDLRKLGLLARDPLYLHPPALDFRLGPASPLIDAGDPADDFSNEPEPNGERVNLGAFGNTPLSEPTGPTGPGGEEPESGESCGCAHIGGVMPFEAASMLPILVLVGWYALRRRSGRAPCPRSW